MFSRLRAFVWAVPLSQSVPASLLLFSTALVVWAYVDGVWFGDAPVVAFFLPTLALTGVLLAFSHVAITRRVTRIVQVTRRFTAGDLRARVGLHGADELAEIGAAFDEMATSASSARAMLAESEARLTAVASEVLRESEQRFRSILAASPVPCALNDEHQNIVYVNPSFVRTFGYDLSEIPTLADWWPKAYPDSDYRQWVSEAWQARMETARRLSAPFERIEVTICTKNAERRTVLADATSLTGSFSGVHLVTLFDITDRKLVEEALRESERRLTTLIANLPGYVYRVANDAAYTPEFVSEGVVQVTGYAQREYLVDRTVTCGAELHPEDRDRVRGEVQAALATRQPYECEYRIETKSGELKHVWERGRGVFDDAGAPLALEGFVTDVTARKRAEVEHAHLEAQLHQSQKLEAVGTLAGGIAHDFNNILGAILGHLALARQDLDPGHPVTKNLAEIHKSSQRAADLVRRLLAFSRPSVAEPRVVHMQAVLEEVAPLVRATLPGSVRLVVDASADVPDIKADPTEIHQVVLNLCANAWQAMDGRTGSLTLALDSVNVEPRQQRTDVRLEPGRYARLVVSDTGMGMDDVTVTRIFDPFFTTKEVGRGTGLGLTVVHGIVTSLGGVITVTSQPGAGTTFELYFPAIDGAAAGRRQHVLFIDDESALVDISTRILERQGYRVTGFTKASAAIAAFRADPHAFDVVVADYNMPDMTGMDVVRTLVNERPGLPVLLASGFVTVAVQAEAAGLGVHQLLSKPYSAEDLCRTVGKLLESTDPAH